MPLPKTSLSAVSPEPTTVPSFFVNPQPETVDSVTELGISDVNARVPDALGNNSVYNDPPLGLY